MSFTPSTYQETIYKEIEDIVKSPKTGRNIVVEADAGTGKTTTIKESTKIIPSDQRILYLAYNTHIADDYRPKALPNTDVRTTHSHGYKAILSTIKYGQKKDVLMDEYKVPNLVKTIVESEYLSMGEENVRLLRQLIPKLVSHLKASLLPITKDSILNLSETYNIENYSIILENNVGKKYIMQDGKESKEYEINSDFITQMCHRIMKYCFNVFFDKYGNTIDYDDQIWLPIVRPDIKIKKFPYVIVDETQDLNPAQLKLVMMSVLPNGSIFVVGDPHQSIYAFRGADSKAMQRITKELNAKVLSLPICYRCPTSHVELAKKYVSSIQPYPKNKVGQINFISDSKLCEDIKNHLPNVEVDGKRQPILALCRNNAPLAKPCFELIRAGVNATIRGRDIGEGLIARIRNTKGTKMTEFLPNLKEWMMNEKSNLESIGKSIESLMDKYDTLMVLSEGCVDTNELIAKIETIFSDKDSAVIFSTIHKSKGLESNIVYNLFFHKLMPSPYAVTEEAQEQEKNLQYISVTRSKDILTFVEESKTLEAMSKIKN